MTSPQGDIGIHIIQNLDNDTELTLSKCTHDIKLGGVADTSNETTSTIGTLETGSLEWDNRNLVSSLRRGAKSYIRAE